MFAKLREQAGDLNIGICLADEANYREIELNSSVLRLGHFFCKENAKDFLIGFLASLAVTMIIPTATNITNNISIENTQNVKVVVHTPQTPFVQPTVTFSVTVENPTTGELKRLDYEGPAENVKDVSEAIDNLWNN